VAKKGSNQTVLGLSLLGMLIAPPLLLYPGATHQNVALETVGYLVLIISMLVPIIKG